MSIKSNAVLLGLVAVGGYFAWGKIKANLNLFNPTSDKNLAYEGSNAALQFLWGDKNATITDLIPGINNTSATKTPSSAALLKLSVLPTKAAPYWYNKDGSKRKTPMARVGTVYGVYGQLMQITDAASQAAAYVSELSAINN